MTSDFGRRWEDSRVALSIATMGLPTVLMLAWGLPLVTLTLHVLHVSEEERLVAGSFLAFAYGLLGTPLLHWLTR